MDISGLVTQDNSEKGVWVQAEIYGKKQPFDVCVLGADSDKVVLYKREIEREAQKLVGTLFGKKQEEDNEVETADDIRNKKMEDAVVRMNGLRSRDKDPLVLQGVELKSDEASYRLICEKIPDLIDFVVNFSNKRVNFLGGRKSA